MKQVRIVDRLVQSGILTEGQRDFALAEQKRTGERLGSVMKRLNLVSEDAFMKILAESAGVEYVQLRPEIIAPEVTSALKEAFARRYRVFPTAIDEDSITVAMPDPLDLATIDRIQQMTGRHVRVQCCSEFDVLTAIDQVYSSEGPSEMEQAVAEAVLEVEARGTAEIRDEPSPAAPIVKLVDHILLIAVRERATDIHFEPERDLLRVRYRIDGVLHHAHYIPKRLENAINSRLKVMSSMDISEQRVPQEGKAIVAAHGREADVRIATFPTVHGETIVLRVLHRDHVALGLDKLGFSERNLSRFRQAVEQPNGLVLVTGPMRSGRTTTLYSALMTLNTTEKKIVTLEDPVEYELPFIRQSQINPRAGLTYATGLQSILRQDPDIILVGELRDRETVETAFRAALTGLLVFSTLHTNDAAAALPRLLDMGVEPYLVASAITGVAAQRLVRVICVTCKVDAGVSPDLARSLGAPENGGFFKGAGCRNCEDTGYRGRTIVSEVILMSPRIRKAVFERADAATIRKLSQEEGMETMLGNGVQKALAGITTLEEVARVV